MNSIKESFDNLPVAVCFFDKRGVVRLMNRRMLSVGAELLAAVCRPWKSCTGPLIPRRSP